jgi:hypothetical protein
MNKKDFEFVNPRELSNALGTVEFTAEHILELLENIYKEQMKTIDDTKNPEPYVIGIAIGIRRAINNVKPFLKQIKSRIEDVNNKEARKGE